MSLTIKDFITTLLAIGTLSYYFAVSRGFELPVLSGYRGAIILLSIIGIGMCALSGTNPPASGIWAITAGIVGAAALIIIIYGLITGAKIAFLLLTITIIILWIIATLRHVLGV